MTTITIDGKTAEVPAGSTVLDAAGQLGIEIPTLCFMKGYEPSTSCQVCLVRNRKTRQLVPACGTKVQDGMEFDSETEDVHTIRRTALELLLSEHVGDCLAPCYFACPAHMDIPVMLQQIGDREDRLAIATIKRDIAIPAILGRICPKPCEKGCRRNSADSPVAVCDLKRYVADLDLASSDPYMPECKPDTGKRVAVIGAGPTGLAAAYYLRQEGHACVMFERLQEPGGRLRSCSEEELPRSVLDGEIAQILRLGVEVRAGNAVGTREQFEQLVAEFDAVLLCCGATPIEQLKDWGLKVGRRGIEVSKETYQTDRQGLFAAGSLIRGKSMVVRSAADGKEAAACIADYLSGGPIRAQGRPFSSRMGRIDSGEMAAFVAGAGDAPREDPAAHANYSDDDARDQSHRCMACACRAHGNCRLERYADMYGADTGRFGGQRRSFEVIGRGGGVIFEPGKCIKCELCVRIAAHGGEPLGLTFVGRGFDVRLRVPFQGTMDEALQKMAKECIDACPTGALAFARSLQGCGGGCGGGCGSHTH